jgi:hypothetical protein
MIRMSSLLGGRGATIADRLDGKTGAGLAAKQKNGGM